MKLRIKSAFRETEFSGVFEGSEEQYVTLDFYRLWENVEALEQNPYEHFMIFFESYIVETNLTNLIRFVEAIDEATANKVVECWLMEYKSIYHKYR